MQQYPFLLGGLPLLKRGRSCSINGENRTGEKGGACHADSPLGFSRKGSPCIGCIPSGAVETLMDVTGSGVIQHIWLTVTDETEKGVSSCGIWCSGCTGTARKRPPWKRRWEISS